MKKPIKNNKNFKFIIKPSDKKYEGYCLHIGGDLCGQKCGSYNNGR